MGCGKSRVGKALSQCIDIPYVDLDSFIEQQEKSSIKSIFEAKGELFFRKIERQYLEQLLTQKEPIILSLGGGTPCYYNSMDYIVSSNSLSFYLKAQIITLRDRLLLEKNSRPLISHLQTDEELTEFIGKHLFERLPFYGKASHTVSVDTGSPKELAQNIKDLI
jgi:shikimate kinase